MKKMITTNASIEEIDATVSMMSILKQFPEDQREALAAAFVEAAEIAAKETVRILNERGM